MQHQLYPGPLKSDDEMGETAESGWIFLTEQVVRNEQHKGLEEEKSTFLFTHQKVLDLRDAEKPFVASHF